MKELVSVHVGETGLRVGADMWNMMAKEHGIGEEEGEIKGNGMRVFEESEGKMEVVWGIW